MNASITTSLFFTFFISFLNVTQAQYFWVGGSGNWSDYENHWATSSGGSTFHAQEPTLSDDVYFDENSFTAIDQVVILDSPQSNCQNFDCANVLFNPQFTSTEDLRIHGSAVFSGDATYNLEFIEVRFGDLETTFTTNGAVFENCLLEFENIIGDGILNLMGDITCSTFRFYEGTFNTNDYAINAVYDIYIGTTGMKFLNLGNSELLCERMRVTGNNLNLNPGTSNISLSRLYADEDGNGPYTFHDLTFIDDDGLLYNSANFNTINANGTAGHQLEFDDGSTITCNNFILNATRQEDVFMHEGYWNTGTVNLVVNSGSVDVSFVRMQGIHASGGATFNVNPGVDLGNNSGWNFTEVIPHSYYWIGDGGDWTDLLHWSSTSGGEADYAELSSRYDNVYFDENSFSDDSQSIILDDDVVMKNLDFSELVNEVLITTVGGGEDWFLHGDLHISDLVNKDLNKIYFKGLNTNTIYAGNQGFVGSFILEDDIVYELQSDLDCGFFRTNGSAVHTNDHNIYCVNSFKLQNQNTFTHELGSSEIYCNDFEVSNSNINLNTGTSIIHVDNVFSGAEHNYFHVILENEEYVNIIDDNNYFQILEFTPGIVSEIEAGTTQTAEEFIIEGTGINPIGITSDEPGEQANFSQSTGIINATFVSLQDNNAMGGATFNALQAVDFGNNTGWNITELQAQDFYWVGGSGNWSDHQNHWATSSGGSTFYDYSPGVIDNVFFDNNSFDAADQVVTVDSENIYCKTMDWSSVNNNPHLSGIDKTLNIYGSLIYSEEMSSDVSIYNFLGEEDYIISPGFENSPGLESDLNLLSSGIWNIQGDLTAENILFLAGTMNTNGHTIDIQNETEFGGLSPKTLNFDSSILNTEEFKFDDPFASNLTINGENSTINCSRTFVVNSNLGENNNLYLNDLNFIYADIPDKYIEAVTLNNLSLEPGVVLRIFNDDVITVNQLIAQGTSDMLIEIKSSFEGTQAVISQSSGTVDGEYLLLQDIDGTGGATFTANNSIDNGNVSGWIFTGIAQSIEFPTIDDVIETIGSFDLIANASSGLPVLYTIIDGPATVDGSTITITGAGTVTVEATQIGDNEFNPAAPVEQEFCANPVQPIISAELEDLFITLNSSSQEGNNWYLDGELYGEFDPSFQTSDNGDFTVQVIIDNCPSEISDPYSVSGLSIQELPKDELLLTYPNPTDGIFSFVMPKAENVQMNIFSTQGDLLISKNISSKAMQPNTINISTFESGVYFLVIECSKGRYFNKIYKVN